MRREEKNLMKNIAKKLASVLLALALLCALAAVPAQAAYGKGTKFVVLGDSIAAGEGASDPAKAYPRLIAGAKGFTLKNYAVGGHTTTDLLAILGNKPEAVQAIREADIINLSIGGNDLLASNVITLVLRHIFLKDSSIVDPYVEAFRGRFAQIIEQIRQLNGKALFLVQTQYNSMQGIPLVGDAYDAAIVKLNKAIVDTLASHPGAFEIADIYNAYKGHDGLVFRDRLHPSDSGHARIAEVLTGMIDGKPLDLTPVDIKKPNFFQQVVIFFRALYDYLSYWLSIYTPWELLRKAFSFM